MAQTSFILFFIVVVALTVCLAWRVADEERHERRSAEEWFKSQNSHAYDLRIHLIDELGAPGSSVRPEGSVTWIYFGVTAALTFTLLGWHNWYVLPPSNTATLLIILNLLTILMSTLILHLSFFGRLLALYKRNLNRVVYLSTILGTTPYEQLDSWWNIRTFVLNDDLSLDYDIGGLAVSATFLITITLFAALISQIYREGLQAMLEPPGSYLAYACMYITCCLIKLFTLATNTYEEQHRHISVLQGVSSSLNCFGSMSTDYNEFAELKLVNSSHSTVSPQWPASVEDDGPICIDDDDSRYLIFSNEMEPVQSNGIPANLSPQKSISKGSQKLGLQDEATTYTRTIDSPCHDDVEVVVDSQTLCNGFVSDFSIVSSPIASNEVLSSDIKVNQLPRPYYSTKKVETSDKLSSKYYGVGRTSFNSDTLFHSRGIPPLGSSKLGLMEKESISSSATFRDQHDRYDASYTKCDQSGSLGGTTSGVPSRPTLARSVSHNTNIESYRQSIAEMISQIRRYDPYPCIFGIPVMPALFNSSKFYIFIGFILIGIRVMVACLRHM
eukprot:CAMPEP_0170368682 /NCGR_PEP_ID=MMETSP0117_2-20130122/7582_1 /TAXON_ID=400756 /ORGANISM="Durinskia baltica, Strain CSIRO CS-38" /LENGTH=555 /DNA_ID=CAMNT_0010623355 /DNA_START=869 /DNA_END=2536 /DNA_ORIENTATION=-